MLKSENKHTCLHKIVLMKSNPEIYIPGPLSITHIS